MDPADQPRLLLVGRPSPTLEIIERAIASSGAEVARALPEQAVESLAKSAPRGVIVVLDGPRDSSVAGALAAQAVAPVLALEAPRAGDDTSPLVRTVEAFARQIAKKRTSQTGAFAGLRFVVVTTQWDKAEVLVRALRAAGATVATADPSGKDWASVRALEPHVALLDVSRAREAELLDRLRGDVIFKWAVHLPFAWEVLEGDGGNIALESLSRIAEGWLAAERDLVRAASKGRMSASLDAIGVARAVRALGELGTPLRVHLTGADGGGHVDLAGGMIVGAVFRRVGDDTMVLDGSSALAAALSIEDAALRSEPYEQPMPANIAAPVADAIKTARLLQGSSQDGPTDPHVGAWKSPDEASTSAPSLHLMIGQIKQLIEEDADTIVHAPASAESMNRPTDPDGAREVSDPHISVEALAPVDQIISIEDTSSPVVPILSTAIPVPVVAPALAPVEPLPAAPVPPPPAQKKGNGALIAGFAVAAVVVIGIGITAAYFATRREETTPPIAGAPRPPAHTAITNVPPPRPTNVPPPVARVDAGRAAPRAIDAGPPAIVPAAIDAGPPETWEDPIARVRPRLRPNMTPSDLNRLTTPIADVNGARMQSDLVLDRAEALIRSRQWSEAERQMQEAYLIYPRNPQVAASIAELYLERQRAEAAVPWARLALSMRRRRPEYIALVQRAETEAGVPSSLPPTEGTTP